MKKIISIMILAALLTVLLVGCSKKEEEFKGPKPEVGDGLVSGGGLEDETKDTDRGGNDQPGASLDTLSGIDAAKLLLAEERLNEKLLQNEGNIFEQGTQIMNELADRALENLGVELRVSLDEIRAYGSLGEEKGDLGTMEVVGNTVVWTDFAEVSNSYEYFLNLTNNIVSQADVCAELIDFVKKNIRIVDRWVDVGGESYYLSVGENEELLCKRSGSGESQFLIVCRRYRNEDGKDVYEMYRKSQSDYETRMTYIPGERYEFSENRNQHFIASNTKGYWENYVLGDIGTHHNVSYLIMKDDVCYTFGFINPEFTAIDILSADRETDLFNYSPSATATSFLLKLNGFSGIEKITAPIADVSFAPDNSFCNLSIGTNTELHTANGKVIMMGQNYVDGKVRVGDLRVNYLAYGYAAEVNISIEGSPEEALTVFEQFLSEVGLTCRRDLDTVLEGTARSIIDSRAVFNYYQWNGHTVNTEDGIRAATEVEKLRYDEILSYYTAIKDVETVVFDPSNVAALESYMSFAPITENQSTGAKMTEGKLTIESLTLTVDDLMLFVEEEPYVVIVALEDGAGAIVHLEQTSTGSAPYAKSERFSVSATGIEIALPHLREGSYRVVAYIATSDGIRSSRFDKVAFASAGETVTLGDVDVSGSLGADGSLVLTYTERVDVYTSLESDVPLAFEGFKQLLCEKAFQYGIPNDTQIERLAPDGSYVALIGNELEIENGEYRVEYTAENGSKKTSGYVYATYCVIEAEPIPESAPAE